MEIESRHLLALVVCFIAKTWRNTAGMTIEFVGITCTMFTLLVSVDQRLTNFFYEGPDSKIFLVL